MYNEGELRLPRNQEELQYMEVFLIEYYTNDRCVSNGFKHRGCGHIEIVAHHVDQSL